MGFRLWFDSSHEVAEDLWDFGTVRHVHARPGGPATLRRAQAQQAQQRVDAQQQQQQYEQQESRLDSNVRSHDFAHAHGASPSLAPSHGHHQSPTYDTVRRAVPLASSASTTSFASSNTPSAHSEYDAYSSVAPSAVDADERARAALDRERERLDALRLDRDEGVASSQPQHRGREREPTQGDEDEDGEGNILDTVALPVLDSVRATRSLPAPRLFPPHPPSHALGPG